jgi:hypothetical protein
MKTTGNPGPIETEAQKRARWGEEGRLMGEMVRAIQGRPHTIAPVFYIMHAKAGLLARLANESEGDAPVTEPEREAWLFGYRFVEGKEEA